MTQLLENIPDKKATLSPKGIVIAAGVLALYFVWTGICLVHFIPWLWGPYAVLFGDAGPLLLTRGGAVVTVGLLPFVLVTAVALLFYRELVRFVILMGITVVSILMYGYYLHHIVHFQGGDESITHWRAEIGVRHDAASPAHIVDAIVLSESLARDGKAPWLPREWTRVEWPPLPSRSRLSDQ